MRHAFFDDEIGKDIATAFSAGGTSVRSDISVVAISETAASKLGDAN